MVMASCNVTVIRVLPSFAVDLYEVYADNATCSGCGAQGDHQPSRGDASPFDDSEPEPEPDDEFVPNPDGRLAKLPAEDELLADQTYWM